MFDIGNVYVKISSRVHLTQEHYITWLSQHWNILEDFWMIGPTGRHPKDLIPSAVRIFISFQAFYVYFKYRNMDRIRLSMDYELWRDFLKPFLRGHPSYGRLDYIGDLNHATKIVACMESLCDQVHPSQEQEESSHRGYRMPGWVVEYLVGVDDKARERSHPARGGSE